MIKKFCAVLLAFSLLAALSSCTGLHVVELSDRLIIQAIGIDKNGNEYELTVQALDTETQGESSSEQKGSKTKNFIFRGESISSALSKVGLKTGLSPLYSQARVIIIGMDTAKNEISEALDYFLREYTTRSDIYVAVAENTAKELVSADFGENVIGADIIENAMKNGEKTGRSTAVPLYEFINLMLSESDCAYCPLIKIRDSDLSESSEVEISGTAIFNGTKIQCTLDEEKTQGLLFLTDKIEESDIVVNTADGKFSLKIVENSTKIKMRTNEKTGFEIISSLTCDIIEYENSSFRRLTAEETAIVAEEASKKIKEIMSETFSFAFFENNSDICRLGKRFQLKAPKEYKKLKSSSDFFALINAVDITVETKVRKIGKEVLQFENG